MFVQVIRGKATDRVEVRREWERWDRELKPMADGYLGSTAGIADDGTFVAMVRFETEAAARREQARDAQTGWWDELCRSLDEVAVHDCIHTDVWARGGSDDAGFVQIRQGRSHEPDRLRDLYVNQQPVRMGPLRPEVIGGLFAWHGDGGFTLSAYFTSEADARDGEHLAEFKSFYDDINAVMHDLTYIDLHDPWLSAG